MGVISKPLPRDEVLPSAQDQARRFAAGPALTLGQTRRLYRRSLESDLRTSFLEEEAAVAMISATDDRNEGPPR